MMKTIPIVEVRLLTKKMGTMSVLSNVNAKIFEGRVNVQGNALARTAFMRSIAFLETPTTGSILLDGEEVFSSTSPIIAMHMENVRQEITQHYDDNAKKMLKNEYNELKTQYWLARMQERKLLKQQKKLLPLRHRRFALVNGYLDFVPNKTVAQNVAQIIIDKKIMSEEDALKRAIEALKDYGFEQYTHKYPCHVTDEELTLLSIVGGMARSPEVLIINMELELNESICSLLDGLSGKLSTIIVCCKGQCQGYELIQV